MRTLSIIQGLRYVIWAGVAAAWLVPAAWAADDRRESLRDDRTTTLKEVTVTAPAGPFLPDVDGTKLYAGKKATVTVLDQLPAIQQNNYRQAFAQAPGLLLSEMYNRGNLHVNYRGIGDPHESQDLLVMKDGLPIVFDRIGYSTVYYQPPLESVDRIELIRGGGALMYGPQPGPVLNFVTKRPPADRALAASTQQTIGSFGTYTTYNQAGGTRGPAGYQAYQYHSHSNGPRANENYDLNTGSAALSLRRVPGDHWTLTVDAHEAEHHEPGRLTQAQYETDRRQTVRPHDRLEISRYAVALTNERELSDRTLATTNLFANYFDRFSLRRTSNTSTQDNLDRRETKAGGFETRVRHDYDAFGGPQIATFGGTFSYAESPRTQDRSAAGTYPSEAGARIFQFDYRTIYGAVFGENRFSFGKLSVVPGARLDLFNQRVKEDFNTGKTSPLHNINEVSVVPLVGLGLQYELTARHQLYGNVSQGYKPPQFDDLAPSGNNTLPATSLDTAKSWTYEAGVRGAPAPWATYDASLFWTDYDDYFGTVTVGSNTQRQNVGQARYSGVDLMGSVDLLGMVRQTDRLGHLNLYGGASLLSAEFVEGPLKGSEPAYAPDYLLRTGVVYQHPTRGKVALSGTFVGDHYWADNNAAGSTGTTGIPTYGVWDLTGELMVWPSRAALLLGINNLFDEAYYSRVRSDGIEPATGRFYYAGMRLDF